MVGTMIGIVLANVESIVAADQIDGHEGLLMLYRPLIMVSRIVVTTPSAYTTCFTAAAVYAASYKDHHTDDKARQWNGQSAARRAFSVPDQVVVVYSAMQKSPVIDSRPRRV